MKIFKPIGHESLKLFLLLVLCLSLLVPSNLKSQDILKVSEVYDYDVGDIYQYRTNELPKGGWSWVKFSTYTITLKYYSTNNDTLFYHRDYKIQWKAYENDEWDISYNQDIIYFTNLDSLVNGGQIDSVYTDTSLFNGRQINSNVTYENRYVITKSFVKGCGLGFEYRYDTMSDYTRYNKLIYFKKGQEEWGKLLPPPVENISTVAEIYDFDIGDVFHFEEEQDSYFAEVNFWAIINTRIINKYYSPNNDTVFYERDIEKKIRSYYDTIFEFFHDTIFYTNLDSLINNGQIDSTYSIPDEYNGRQTNIRYTREGESYTTIKYSVGCGISYDHIIDPKIHWYFWTLDLVYFKKGTEEWGTPEYVSPEYIETINDKYNLQIYPNPANNFVTIESKTKIKSVSILSFQGKRIKSFTVESKNASIDISGLTSNIYILEIDFGDNLVHKKLIKE